MDQSVPYCSTCKQQREAQLATIQELRRKRKGKGKAKAWMSDDESSEEEDEWGGGEPGIIKVCSRECEICSPANRCSPTSHSLVKRSIRLSIDVCTKIERRWTCSSSLARVSGSRQSVKLSVSCKVAFTSNGS